MVGLWFDFCLPTLYPNPPDAGALAMDEIPISKFKATCLAVLAKVKKTGRPILVTRFGHPVAQIVPPEPINQVPKFGSGIGTAEILGDVVGPISDISNWDAGRDPEEKP
jgi:prevent-host-death family protein